MIELRGYLPCDVFEVQRRNGDFINLDADVGEASVFAATFVSGTRPVGCVGGQVQWPGVAQIWAVLSDDLRGHGLAVTRACRRLLARECEKYAIRRVHCLVRADNGEYLRWISLLGFEHEFTMHRAAPDGADLWGMTRWSDGWNSGHAVRRESAGPAGSGAGGYGSSLERLPDRGNGRERAA